MISIHHYKSPMGDMTEASDGKALTGLWFDGQKYFPKDLLETSKDQVLPVFAETDRWLDLYFEGKIPDFTPPIKPATTPFRQAVFDILLTIPYGQTITYGDLAKRLASKKGLPHMSAQAVGGAVGHNPISIIIPCHRVLGKDGSLTGYAGGVDRKAKLLILERLNAG